MPWETFYSLFRFVTIIYFLIHGVFLMFDLAKKMKFYKENLGNIVHNSFSLIDLLHSYSGKSLLIPKGRICRPVVVDDDDDDTSMATMICHPLLLPILMRKRWQWYFSVDNDYYLASSASTMTLLSFWKPGSSIRLISTPMLLSYYHCQHC